MQTYRYQLRIALAAAAALLLLLPVYRFLHAQERAQQATQLHPGALSVMSGALELAALQELGLLPKPSPELGAVAPQTPNTSVQFRPASYNITNSAEHDVETQVLTTSAGGTEYTVVTHMRFSGGAWHARYIQLNGVTTLATGELTKPANYNSAIDPSLDANLYGGGVSPGRIYNAGAFINGTGVPSAIAVWYSDNQGSTWAGPTIVTTETTSPWILDHPTVVVSPHAGTLGYVYVIYARIQNTTPPLVQLYVAKSTNGGVNFGSPSLVTSGTYLGGHQVLVAQNTGRVLPLWLDYGSGQAKMCQSGDNGDISFWQSFETAFTATYNFLGGQYPYTLSGGISAKSLLVARFNRPLNRVCMVWHEAEQPGLAVTDSYYTCKTSTGWLAKVRVNDVATNDQFQPSLALDSSGSAYVGFYDRREDPANDYFKLYGARLSADGVSLSSNYAISTNPNSADFFAIGPHFMGDYTGSWWHSPGLTEWITAYTGQEVIQPTYYGDVYLGFSYY